MSPFAVSLTKTRPNRPGSSASTLKDGSVTLCIQSIDAGGVLIPDSQTPYRQIFLQSQDRCWVAPHTLWDGPPILTVRVNKRRQW